jgi:multimeric flavodoxin WrbA
MKIITIVGSPRKGNSEAIAIKLKELLAKKGIDNNVILLRELKIHRCVACVEFCNHNLKCRYKDDMEQLLDKYVAADGYIMISPNYFQMPTGLLKDFIDRSGILMVQKREEHFKKKKAVVITIGNDIMERIQNCASVIANNYFGEIGLIKILKKSFTGKSELQGHYNDIFDNGINPEIIKDLQECANFFVD